MTSNLYLRVALGILNQLNVIWCSNPNYCNHSVVKTAQKLGVKIVGSESLQECALLLPNAYWCTEKSVSALTSSLTSVSE